MAIVRSDSLLFIAVYCFVLLCSQAFAQISTQELENENAQEIANRSYVEEQTELQRTLLSKYSKRVRPVNNASEPIVVALHVYIMHVSVNEIEQTITLNGHIYMTWKDESAVWEPSEYNGVSITMVKQWEIWTPELRVTNSVSGVGQFFEISKRSHVIIHSNGKASSRVEMYPTFSIKIGCAFDYSAYPFDRQKCALGLYTGSRMSEVQLSVYYNMQPTVMLGWGSQAEKKQISDWILESVTMNASYYSGGKYMVEQPASPEDLDVSWSILYTWLALERNASTFTLTILLPAVISYLFVILSFLMVSPEAAIYMLLADLFFLGIFLEDFTAMLPPAIGGLPKIVWFTGASFVLISCTLIIQLWLRHLLKRTDPLTKWSYWILDSGKILPKSWRSIDGIFRCSSDDGQQAATWGSVVNHLRLICALIFTIEFFVSFLIVII